MSAEPKRVELTEAEQNEIRDAYTTTTDPDLVTRIVTRIVAAREAEIWDEAKVVMARPVPRAWRKWCDDADAKVERVLALIEGAERRSPIGAEHDRKHPDEPASVLVPTRDIRAALSLEAEGD